MATKLTGLNMLLYVGATPAALGSERSVTVSVSGNTVDTSDKSSAGWGDSMATFRSCKIDVSGDLIVADSSGMAAIRTAANAGTSLALKVRDTTNVKQWSGTFYIDTYSEEAAHDNVVKMNASFSNSGAVTYTTY